MASFRAWCAAAMAGMVVGVSAAAGAGDEDLRKYKGEPVVVEGMAAVSGMPRYGQRDSDSRSMFDSQNMTLYAWWPLSSFPNSQTSGNDCWGYVSPSGREYAIMGLAKGFAFVEVTDPWNTTLVGMITGPNSLWHDVKVIGHYAYGVSEGGSGIQVIDMSQIDNGVVTLVQNKTQGGHSTTHNIVANVDSGFLYLVGTNINNGGLTAISTANPSNPTIVGAWNSMYVHDAQVVTYTDGPYAGREIAFCLSGLNGGWNSTGLRIVDVTDKANMFTVSQAFWSGARYAHQGWLSEDRKYFYINDELDEGDSVSVTTTRIFDVSDIYNPVYLGWFTSGAQATDHNLYTHDGKIFEANYKSGLRVFDKTNPTAPVQIAYFDTYPESNTSGFNGAWSTYPYFPSGTILISDLDRGLFVVRLDGVSIDFDGVPPTKLTPNQPTPVSVVISPQFEGYDAGSVTLHLREAGGEWQEFAMAAQGGDLFTGIIPGQDCLDEVEYYASVRSDKGTTITTSVVDAKAVGDVIASFHDDFETNKGWTVGAPGDDATMGIWGRMAPQATDAQPGADVSDPGTICYVTDGRAGTSIGQYDVDNGKTTLLSPWLDVSGLTEPTIGYWRWYSNDKGAAPNTDTFRVDITTNGTQWVNVETLGPSGPFTSGGWYYHEFKVADFANTSGSVRLRFIAEDLDPGSIVEAAIDEFSLFEYDCSEPPCVADFNGDTVVNSLDVLAFLNAYSAGDPRADINGDTVVNSLDVLAFLNLYNLGC